jgi:hypothetical protein
VAHLLISGSQDSPPSGGDSDPLIHFRPNDYASARGHRSGGEVVLYFTHGHWLSSMDDRQRLVARQADPDASPRAVCAVVGIFPGGGRRGDS